MAKKKSSKNINKGKQAFNPTDRELELKENLEEYGKIASLLGDRRVNVIFPDGTEILGHIPRRLKRQRQFVKVDDVVLVSIRDFQDNKVDIIHKYNEKEIKKLIQYGEIPESFERSHTTFGDTEDKDGVIFEEKEESDTEIDFDEI